MRSLKKLLAVLLSLTMVLSLMVVPAFAAESLEYEDEARVLYDLGLFKGTSATEYVPNLDSRLERQEGVVLVLRLFGLEEEANAMDEKEAKALLAEKFSDADEIGAWAVKAMAYAVENGIVNGRPDGKFAPKDPLLGKEFAKMILAELDQYDPNNFQTACADLSVISDLSPAEALRFNDKILIRDDVVGISFASLAATYADGDTVLGKLAAASGDFKSKAIEAGVIKIVKVVSTIAPITINVGDEYELPAKVEVEYSTGEKEEVAVTWDTTAVKADVAGDYTAKGTIVNYEDDISVAIKVEDIALDVKSVAALSNNKIKVVLNTAAKSVAAKAFALKAEDGTAVEVKDAAATVDMKTVYVNTADMTPGNKYTLTINENAFDFVAQVARTAKLEAASAVSKNNIEVEVTFSADVDPLTALDPANYTIDKDLTVSGVVAGTNANQVILMTSSQKAGELYKVTVANVTDELGNGLDTSKNVVYFGGKAPDTTAPTASAASATNTRFTITFNEDMDEASVLNLDNYTIDGGLTIVSVTYKNKVATFTTTSQTAGTLYTVKINNVADKFANKIAANTAVYFGGRAADKTAPTVTSAQSESNKSVKITFSDSSDIDSATASAIENYSIEGLTITAAKYDAGSKSVTLTTSAQTAGALYKVVVNNVKDEYGNTIAANSAVYFGGRAVNTANPTYTAAAISNTEVEITFSAKIDSATLKPYNFKVVDLGYALAAKIDPNDSTKVKITTLPQTSGTIYTLEVRDVTNTDGTPVKADSKTTFAGIGSASSAAPKVLAAMAIDNKTIVVTLDSELAALPTTANATITLSDDTLFSAADTVDWYLGSKKQVVINLPAAKTLVEGTLYKAKLAQVIGTNGVAISANNSSAQFAGVGNAPVGAVVLTATPEDITTVSVFFDKPVAIAGNDASAFTLWNQADNTPIKYENGNDVEGQIVVLSSDKKEAKVYFKTASPLALTEGTIYTIRIDTAKVTKVENAKDKAYAKVQFGAINTPRADAKIQAAVAQSRYVVDVVFNVPVKITGNAATMFTIDGDSMPVVKLAQVVDSTKVRLYFDETGKTAIEEGNVYKIKYTKGANDYIVDNFDPTNIAASADVTFASMATIAQGPAITGVSAVNANTINVTLDQAALGGTLKKENITLTGYAGAYEVVPAGNNKSFKIIATDNIFEAGSSYTVALTANVKDVSDLRSSPTTATSFGGIGNVNLVLTASVAAGNVTVTLKDSADAVVVGKELILRSEAGIIEGNATQTDAAGQVTWTAPEAGTYLIQATDGSVSITLVIPAV
jgi:ribosome-binding factor A